jgi:hypothetical protein
MVVILWPGGTVPPMPSPNEHLEGSRIGEASPIRMCSFHICLPDTPVFNVIRSALILIIGERERARMKIHSGECVGDCQTYSNASGPPLRRAGDDDGDNKC